MKETFLILLLATINLTTFSSAQAQQPAKIPRIGWITSSPLPGNARRVEAFRQGLRELGYVEGKNIMIDWRAYERNQDRASEIVAEWVRQKFDIIVTSSAGATRAVKATNATIPIVMSQGDDPVASGFVVSLARPGGNITGLSTLSPELWGKRLELLNEIVPKLGRVAMVGSSTSVSHRQELKEVEAAAAAVKMKVLFFDALAPKDLEFAFRAAAKERCEAVLMNASGGVANTQRSKIAELAVKSRLPTIYGLKEYVEAGGLISYGVSQLDLDRRAATFVDKILKGRSPADLPVEQPMKFEFIANLKAAKAIGLTIPPNVLVRADQVIR